MSLYELLSQLPHYVIIIIIVVVSNFLIVFIALLPKILKSIVETVKPLIDILKLIIREKTVTVYLSDFPSITSEITNEAYITPNQNKCIE